MYTHTISYSYKLYHLPLLDSTSSVRKMNPNSREKRLVMSQTVRPLVDEDGEVDPGGRGVQWQVLL